MGDVDEFFVMGLNVDLFDNFFGGWMVFDFDENEGLIVWDGLEYVVDDGMMVMYELGVGLDEFVGRDVVVSCVECVDVMVVVFGELWYFYEFGLVLLCGENGGFL